MEKSRDEKLFDLIGAMGALTQTLCNAGRHSFQGLSSPGETLAEEAERRASVLRDALEASMPDLKAEADVSRRRKRPQ